MECKEDAWKSEQVFFWFPGELCGSVQGQVCLAVGTACREIFLAPSLLWSFHPDGDAGRKTSCKHICAGEVTKVCALLRDSLEISVPAHCGTLGMQLIPHEEGCRCHSCFIYRYLLIQMDNPKAKMSLSEAEPG